MTADVDANAIIKPSSCTDKLTYAVRDIILLANKAKAAGKELLFLNIGDPNAYDFDTPPHIIDAIINKGLRNRRNGYAPSSGWPESVEAIHAYATSKGIAPIQEIFVGHGASEPIELALTALLEPGDNILTPAPGYPLYTAVLAKLRAHENPYFLDEDNDWQPDVEDMARRINARTRAIVVINPNNPTGSLASDETLQKIVALAKERGLPILSDEIYDQLTYDGLTHTSLAKFAGADVPVLTFNGLSKVFFGPGLRVGWCIASGPDARMRPWIDATLKLTRARLCASSPVMSAIPDALHGPKDFLVEAKAKLQRRRDITFEQLNAIDGISCVKPRGAFYAFPRITADIDEQAFVQRAIMEAGVVIVNGSGFGQAPGTKHFRVVFCPPEDTLTKAYAALANLLTTPASS